MGGVLWAPDVRLAISGAINHEILVFVPIFAGALVVGSHPRSVRSLLITFYLIGALTVTLGLMQLSASSRLVVLEQNTIQRARAALFVPIIGVGLMVGHRSGMVRMVGWVMIPAAILVAIASGSRGPIMMLLVLGVFATVRYFTRPSGVTWNVVFVALGLAIATAMVLVFAADELPGASTARFQEFGEFVQAALGGEAGGANSDTSSGARVLLLDLAATLYAQNPVLGVGTSGFEALNPILLGANEHAVYPHNALMRFAAEYGTVGLGLFIVVAIVAISRRLPPVPGMSTLRWLGLFFLLNSMVSGDVFDDREMWGLLMLMLLARDPRRRDSRTEVTAPMPETALKRPSGRGDAPVALPGRSFGKSTSPGKTRRGGPHVARRRPPGRGFSSSGVRSARERAASSESPSSWPMIASALRRLAIHSW